MVTLTRPARAVASAGGRLLAGATELLADVRSAEKPLHPHGQLLRATLRRYGAGPAASGVRWLDESAEDEALVRTSRAIGTPEPLPDVFGLAVRIPDRVGYADLLLATTAWNPVGRHVLLPARGTGRTLTTLLPYRTVTGPVVLGARRVDASRYELCWARLGRSWQPLGSLALELPADQDAVVSFDPVLNHPPGMTHYPWATRLRERAYATARSHRR